MGSRGPRGPGWGPKAFGAPGAPEAPGALRVPEAPESSNSSMAQEPRALIGKNNNIFLSLRAPPHGVWAPGAQGPQPRDSEIHLRALKRLGEGI